MHPYTYTFSFRIRHPENDIQEIIDTLKAIPGFRLSRSWKKGEARQTLRGESLDGIYEDSYCFFQFFDQWQSSEVNSLTEAIEQKVEKLNSQKRLLLEHIASGGQASFFVGLGIDSNSGLIFDANLLRKLSELGIGLEFDIYPPDEKPANSTEE